MKRLVAKTPPPLKGNYGEDYVLEKAAIFLKLFFHLLISPLGDGGK